jgi:hypothetical protein
VMTGPAEIAYTQVPATGSQRGRMSLETRLPLYRELEERRGRPLIVYVTSARQGFGAAGIIAGDAIGELLLQLCALPRGTDALDLLVVSAGGDPTVAWRIVSLIREKVRRFSVLVPEAAFSAATLIALGADEIVMHPHGNLGPVDPQISAASRKTGERGPGAESVQFGSEDLAAFLAFAREQVGVSDQEELFKVFALFCRDVGAVPIGVAARSAQLSLYMGEQLLRLHMTDEAEGQKARAIAEALSKKFYHHGYPLNRTEAGKIGLKVQNPPVEVEELQWRIWSDLREELELREPFNPNALLAANPACSPLFAPAPQLSVPANLPPPVMQQIIQNVLEQIQIVAVPPTPFGLINALIESPRLATRFVTEGRILATRLPDLQLQIRVAPDRASWRTVPIPQAAGGAE